jgi:quercetin dioxygenase-like cupin family protein
MAAKPTKKVNISEIDFAEGLRRDEGWNDMKVQFLITAENADNEEIVFGRTLFEPGASHEAHRHAHAEEVQYLLRGEGIVLDGDDEIPMTAGDVILTHKNVWHGFRNTSATETAELIWAWAGAASRETAGYEARDSAKGS